MSLVESAARAARPDKAGPPRMARAFAPASIGNVAVGFDLLGHALQGAGDEALVRWIPEPEVRMEEITGVVRDLPLEARANTAGQALIALREALGLKHGFALSLHKGIALGSGMGGSAASSVAALVAANTLLEQPLSRQALYPFALDGEAVSTGSRHGDNLGPMLLGGLVLATSDRLVPIPVPEHWHCALVHPHYILETRRARQALAGSYELGEFVAQSANLALVLSGCHQQQPELVRAGLRDVLIEPRRASLVPAFDAVKQAALDHHALGASISGGGPSVFGWYENRADAQGAAEAMQAAFAAAGLDSDACVSPIASPGARLLETSPQQPTAAGAPA